ncbi:casparian strip membrane protein 5-like [Pyrus x bretschneideri]|uniref:casparian strip membrane protein 5-like n=1 Tax=Pyrus x bretschneideri TaxID=225117 RepID=UPI002030E745|nr:casparian strip membrane protein 5-like [Pyrus x bretschneideri]
MDSKKNGETVAISTDEKANYGAEGKTAEVAPPPAVVTTKATKIQNMGGGWRKGLAIIDFVLQLGAGSAALAAAYITGNTEQILPFFTQFFQFHAQDNDLPTLTYETYIYA